MGALELVDEEVVSLPVELSLVDVSLLEVEEEEEDEEEVEEDEEEEEDEEVEEEEVEEEVEDEDEDEDENPSVSVVVVSVDDSDSCSVTVSVVVVELDVKVLLALRVVELELVALALVATGCSPSDVPWTPDEPVREELAARAAGGSCSPIPAAAVMPPPVMRDRAARRIFRNEWLMRTPSGSFENDAHRRPRHRTRRSPPISPRDPSDQRTIPRRAPRNRRFDGSKAAGNGASGQRRRLYGRGIKRP